MEAQGDCNNGTQHDTVSWKECELTRKEIMKVAEEIINFGRKARQQYLLLHRAHRMLHNLRGRGRKENAERTTALQCTKKGKNFGKKQNGFQRPSKERRTFLHYGEGALKVERCSTTLEEGRTNANKISNLKKFFSLFYTRKSNQNPIQKKKALWQRQLQQREGIDVEDAGRCNSKINDSDVELLMESLQQTIPLIEGCGNVSLQWPQQQQMTAFSVQGGESGSLELRATEQSMAIDNEATAQEGMNNAQHEEEMFGRTYGALYRLVQSQLGICDQQQLEAFEQELSEYRLSPLGQMTSIVKYLCIIPKLYQEKYQTLNDKQVKDESQIRALVQQIQERDEAIQESLRDKKSLEENKRQLDVQLRTAESNLSIKDCERRALAEKVTILEVDKAQAENKARQLGEELNTAKMDAISNKKKAETLNLEKTKLTRQRQYMTEAEEKYKQDINRQKEEIESLKNQIQEQGKQVEEYEDKIKKVESDLEASKQSQRETSEVLAQASSKLTKQKTRPMPNTGPDAQSDMELDMEPKDNIKILHSMISEMSSLSEESAASQQKIEEQAKEIEKLRSDNQREVMKSEQKILQLQNDSKKQQELNNQLKSALEEKESKLKTMENDLKKTKEEKARNDESSKSLEEKNKQLAERINQLTENVNEANKEKARLSEQLDEERKVRENAERLKEKRQEENEASKKANTQRNEGGEHPKGIPQRTLGDFKTAKESLRALEEKEKRKRSKANLQVTDNASEERMKEIEEKSQEAQKNLASAQETIKTLEEKVSESEKKIREISEEKVKQTNKLEEIFKNLKKDAEKSFKKISELLRQYKKEVEFVSKTWMNYYKWQEFLEKLARQAKDIESAIRFTMLKIITRARYLNFPKLEVDKLTRYTENFWKDEPLMCNTFHQVYYNVFSECVSYMSKAMRCLDDTKDPEKGSFPAPPIKIAWNACLKLKKAESMWNGKFTRPANGKISRPNGYNQVTTRKTGQSLITDSFRFDNLVGKNQTKGGQVNRELYQTDATFIIGPSKNGKKKTGSVGEMLQADPAQGKVASGMQVEEDITKPSEENARGVEKDNPQTQQQKKQKQGKQKQKKNTPSLNPAAAAQKAAPQPQDDEMCMEQDAQAAESASPEKETNKPQNTTQQSKPKGNAKQSRGTQERNGRLQQKEPNAKQAVSRPQGGLYEGRLRPRSRTGPPIVEQCEDSQSTTSQSSSSAEHSSSQSGGERGSGDEKYSHSGRSRRGRGRRRSKGKHSGTKHQKKGGKKNGKPQHQQRQNSRKGTYNDKNDEKRRKEMLEAMYEKFKDFSRNIDDVVDSETQRCKYWTNSQTVGRELPRAIREDVATAVELLSRGIYSGQGAKQREVELAWNAAVLLNFPAIFLTPPKFLNDKNHYKANEAIKKALRRFIDYGELPSCDDRAPHHTTEGYSKRTGVSKPLGDMQPLSTKQQQNIEKAVMAGNVGKAARSFDPQPMADVRQKEVKEQLGRLHPQSANPQPFEGIEIPNIKEAVIDKEDVAEVVTRLPKGRAMGPAKWAYETLKYLSKSCKHFNEAIAKLAQLLSVGKFPHEEMLKEAELIAIEKAKGSYRPIAMGNSLPKLLIMLVLKARNREYEQEKGFEELRQAVRRQTEGATTKQQNGDIEMTDTEAGQGQASGQGGNENETNANKGKNKDGKEKTKARQGEAVGNKYILEETKVRKSYLGLSKEQLGVNTPCGVEAPGFIANELFKQKKLIKFFTIDISNAFNTVNRRQMALEVQKLRPDLLPLVAQLYRTPTELELADGTTITSQEGVRQGDPLSSFLYSLVTDRILRKEVEIAERYNCRVFAYLDDHSFLLDDTSIPSLTVEKVIEEIEEDLKELSLKVNVKKCYTYIPRYVQDKEVLKHEAGKDDESLKRDGCKFLGSPVGDESYIQQVIDTKLKKADAVFRHLKSVKKQAGYQVVRLSLAAEAMHLYRSLGDKMERFKQWDEKLFDAVLQLSDREEEYKYICDQRHKANIKLPQLLLPPDGGGGGMEVEEPKQAEADTTEYREIRSNLNKILRPIRKGGGDKLSLGELNQLEADFKRAKLMATLKQSNGGLGIALPQMTATPAHLGYVLDCLKLIRERGFDVTLSKETIDFVQNNRDLIDAAGILIPDDWQDPQTKFYISKGSVQHPLTTEVQRQVLDGIRRRLLGWVSKKKLEEEEGYSNLVKNILDTISKSKTKRGKRKDRAYGLEQDNRGDGASLSLSMSAFKSYFSFTNKVMAELLATKMLIPNRYGITSCDVKKQSNSVNKQHSAWQLNHAYSCSNKGSRTMTHTQVADYLSNLLFNLGYKSEREQLLTWKGDKYYGDIYVDSLHCIIDVTGVTTSEQDASLEEAMRKRWTEKCIFYHNISRSKYFKRRYTTSVIIPFVFGPHGQIYAESQRALFERLGVTSPDISPAKREAGRNSYTSKRYLDNTISEQALRDLKFGWKQLKKHIVQCTMENAIEWCKTQTMKQKINPRKYHRFYSVQSSEDQESNTTSTTKTESSSTSSTSHSSTTSSSTSSSSSNSSSTN